MKKYTNNTILYIEQEAIQNDSPSISWLNQIKTTVAAFGNTVSAWLINEMVKSSEPKIYRLVNSEGEMFWEVYNPVNNKTLTFHNEEDVRFWLEARYNDV